MGWLGDSQTKTPYYNFALPMQAQASKKLVKQARIGIVGGFFGD